MSPDPEVPEEPPLRGIDLARRALEEARAAAKASGKSVGQGRSSPLRTGRGTSRKWSGSGADQRDPQTLGSLTSGIVRSRNWSDKVNEGTVFGRWTHVVGDDIASHRSEERRVGKECLL